MGQGEENTSNVWGLLKELRLSLPQQLTLGRALALSFVANI